MAMPPRSSKGRGGSQRWLVVPLVLTLAVLLVDASMHARSTKPEATLNSQAWVDKVLPQIAQSSAQGSELAQVSSGAVATGGSSAIASELSSIAGASVTTYKAVVADRAPRRWLPPPASFRLAWPLASKVLASCRPPSSTCWAGTAPRQR